MYALELVVCSCAAHLLSIGSSHLYLNLYQIHYITPISPDSSRISAHAETWSALRLTTGFFLIKPGLLAVVRSKADNLLESLQRGIFHPKRLR